MSNVKVPSQRPRAMASTGTTATPPFATVEVDDSPTRRETLDIEAMIRRDDEAPRSAGVPQLGSPTIPEVSRVTASPTVPSTYVRPKHAAPTEPNVPRTTMPATIGVDPSIVASPKPAVPVVSHRDPVPRAPFAPQIMAASPPASQRFGAPHAQAATAPLPSGPALAPALTTSPVPTAPLEPSFAPRSEPQGAAFASPPRSHNPSQPSPWTRGAPPRTPTPAPVSVGTPPPSARPFAPPPPSRPAAPESERATPPGARLLPYLVAGSCFLLGVVATVLLANRLSAGSSQAPGVAAVVETAAPPTETPVAAVTPAPTPPPSAPVVAASAEPPAPPTPAEAAPPPPAAVTTPAAATKPPSAPPKPRQPAPPGTPKRVVPPDPF